MANRETIAAISGEPLSHAEIETFVAEWYLKLDQHAPAEELLPLVSEQCLVMQVKEECLEMQFPEGGLSGPEEFRRWYEGVIRIFFDEVHTLTRVSSTWKDDRAVVDVVVNWQAQREAAANRSRTIGETNRKAMADAKARDEKVRVAVPLRMSAFAEELARQLPKDAIIFDEVLTYSPELCRWLSPDVPGQFFQTRGGSLGVGVPGAIGLKLANPDRTVIGLSGDGGSMYTIQALWTAARHRIAAKFVICNNHGYRILKFNLQQYWQEQGLKPRDYPSFPNCFTLTGPDLDFVSLAKALGVAGARVTQTTEIAPTIKAMLEHEGPYLIDLVVDGNVPAPA